MSKFCSTFAAKICGASFEDPAQAERMGMLVTYLTSSRTS